MTKRSKGRIVSGRTIDDALAARLADEAETGYDVDRILSRRASRGRPRLGSGPSTIESVRLDPDLKARLVRRADESGVPVSEVIREALRRYLEAS